jgi:hypothetical protein
MATATKPAVKKPAPKAKVPVKAKPRPLLEPAEIKTEETEWREDYPNIVKGSLRNIGDDPDHRKLWKAKRTLEIRCDQKGCNEKRRIATSDLHQCKLCNFHTVEERHRRRREARAAQAEKPK